MKFDVRLILAAEKCCWLLLLLVFPSSSFVPTKSPSRQVEGGFVVTSHLLASILQSATNNDVSPLPSSVLPWDWMKVAEDCWSDCTMPIVMFDGECNLCNGAVNIALDMDTTCQFRFCSLESKIGQSLLAAHGHDPSDRNSIVLVQKEDDDKSYLYEKSMAVLRIARRLDGAPWWVKTATKLGRFTPAFLLDQVLTLVADNRQWLGEQIGWAEYDQCRLDFDGEFTRRFLYDHDMEAYFTTSGSCEDCDTD